MQIFPEWSEIVGSLLSFSSMTGIIGYMIYIVIDAWIKKVSRIFLNLFFELNI